METERINDKNLCETDMNEHSILQFILLQLNGLGQIFIN